MAGRRHTDALRVALALLALHALPAAQASDESLRLQTEDARKATTELVTQVRGELMKAIEMSGPMRAIVVCKYTVPEISSSISRKYGARVTRVSLRPRNPALGWADAWEQSAMLNFESRLARGEKTDGMEHAEIVTEPAGRFFRYARALPQAPACMHCHGPAEQMSEAIRAQLASEYPHDRAIGIPVGALRGAVTFKKPLP